MESGPTHKVGVPLEDWKQWRTEINNCLVKKMVTGDPGRSFVPFSEYLDYPSRLSLGEEGDGGERENSGGAEGGAGGAAAGGGGGGEGASQGGRSDNTTPRNLLVYSNSPENKTALKKRDFLNYGIPRVTKSATDRTDRMSAIMDFDVEDVVEYDAERSSQDAVEFRDADTQTAGRRASTMIDSRPDAAFAERRLLGPEGAIHAGGAGGAGGVRATNGLTLADTGPNGAIFVVGNARSSSPAKEFRRYIEPSEESAVKVDKRERQGQDTTKGDYRYATKLPESRAKSPGRSPPLRRRQFQEQRHHDEHGRRPRVTSPPRAAGRRERPRERRHDGHRDRTPGRQGFSPRPGRRDRTPGRQDAGRHGGYHGQGQRHRDRTPGRYDDGGRHQPGIGYRERQSGRHNARHGQRRRHQPQGTAAQQGWASQFPVLY